MTLTNLTASDDTVELLNEAMASVIDSYRRLTTRRMGHEMYQHALATFHMHCDFIKTCERFMALCYADRMERARTKGWQTHSTKEENH